MCFIRFYPRTKYRLQSWCSYAYDFSLRIRRRITRNFNFKSEKGEIAVVFWNLEVFTLQSTVLHAMNDMNLQIILINDEIEKNGFIRTISLS